MEIKIEGAFSKNEVGRQSSSLDCATGESVSAGNYEKLVESEEPNPTGEKGEGISAAKSRRSIEGHSNVRAILICDSFEGRESRHPVRILAPLCQPTARASLGYDSSPNRANKQPQRDVDRQL